MTVADGSTMFYEIRRDRRVAELNEELRHVRDRFHRRLIEKELAATIAARPDERARAMRIARMMEGRRHA